MTNKNQFLNNIDSVIKWIKEFLILIVYLLFILGFEFLLILLFYESLITLINPLVFALFLLMLIFSLFLLKRKNMLNCSKGKVFQSIFILWLSLQSLVVISIELKYNEVRYSYSQEYLSLTENGFDDVNATWSITNSFCEEYNGVYGKKNIELPSRKIFTNSTGLISLMFNPILYFYFLDSDNSNNIAPREGYFKLVIAQNSGCCGEFASSMELLLEDIAGFETRVICMEGKDHAFPEIKINDEWWVFDRIYTTPSQPVKSGDYALFLEDKELSNYICDLNDASKKTSVLSEHGFNSSNLTIIAVESTTTNRSNDEPKSDATVEIFAFVNSYDPLVNCGKTDENGQYYANLRSDKRYLIMVETKNAFGASTIGFNETYLPLNDDISVVVYLHKYD